MKAIPDTDTLIEFALGTLEPETAKWVEQAVSESPALALELSAWQKSLAAFGSNLPAVTPSVQLEARVISAIRQAHPPISRRAAPQPSRRASPRANIFLALTSALSAVGLLAAVFFLWRNQSLEQQISALQRVNATRVQVLSASSAIQLASNKNIPIGKAFLTPNGQLVIALSLPEPQAGKTYQAWFIEQGQSTPRPLQTLSTSLDAVVPSNVAAIAISLEPSGGSTTPTEVLGVGVVKF